MATVFGEPTWDADYLRDSVNRVRFTRQAPYDFCYLLDARNKHVDLHRKEIYQMIDRAIFHEFTGSFATYGIPSAADLLVHPVSEFRATPSPLVPLGAKGIGESGTIGVPAAVAGAVADALAPLGVRHVDPPFTPEKLWRLIRDPSLYGAASGADKGRERP